MGPPFVVKKWTIRALESALKYGDASNRMRICSVFKEFDISFKQDISPAFQSSETRFAISVSEFGPREPGNY
ncbi:hypothetical protein MXB_4581 [Myxobolus squamalis]|nr:hypothetical protein MXB_4581 [Myxobolus squamalis]